LSVPGMRSAPPRFQRDPPTRLGMSGPTGGRIRRAAPGTLRGQLGSDPRSPGWILRAVGSAVAGTAVSFMINWRLGLTVAAVIAIADTILRSRASGAHGAAPRAVWAHQRTRRRLARLDRAGYRSLHARAVPGSQCVIDHLVVGPGGIYSVDAERWDRRMPIHVSQGGKIYHGPFCQADRLARALSAAEEAGRLLSDTLGQYLAVQAAMVIYGPTVPWTVASIGGVDVLGRRRLRKYLFQGGQARPAARLEPEEIERIYTAAAQALPPAS
jgi:Nuclease-related domain